MLVCGTPACVPAPPPLASAKLVCLSEKFSAPCRLHVALPLLMHGLGSDSHHENATVEREVMSPL